MLIEFKDYLGKPIGPRAERSIFLYIDNELIAVMPANDKDREKVSQGIYTQLTRPNQEIARKYYAFVPRNWFVVKEINGTGYTKDICVKLFTCWKLITEKPK